MDRRWRSVEALVLPGGDGAVGEEGGETALAGVQEVLHAADVEVGLLLTGEACVGQILGRGRGTHGHVHVLAVLLLQLAVGLGHGGLQVCRELQAADEGADAAAALHQVVHVVGVEALQDALDPVHGPGAVQQVPVPPGGDGEAAGHGHTLGRQVAVHFAQARVLAAHQRHVLDADLVEPENEGVFLFHGAFLLEGQKGAGFSSFHASPWGFMQLGAADRRYFFLDRFCPDCFGDIELVVCNEPLSLRKEGLWRFVTILFQNRKKTFLTAGDTLQEFGFRFAVTLP